MTKRLCALILFACMLVSFSVPAMAEEAPFGMQHISENSLVLMEDSLDILLNGGFEYTSSYDALAGWTISAPDEQGYLGSEMVRHNDIQGKTADEEAKIVQSGKKAVRLTNAGDGTITLIQPAALKRTDGTSEYKCELSISAYQISDAAKLDIDVLVIMDGEIGEDITEKVSYSFDVLEKGKWTKKMTAFTVPSNTRQISVRPSLVGAGDIVLDDITLLQKCDAEFIEAAQPRVKKDPVPGTPANIIGAEDPEKNGNTDFETVQEGGSPWTFLLDTPKDQIFSTADNHTPGGQRCLNLMNIENTRGRAYHKIYNLVPGATYQVRWFYKISTPVQTTVSYEFKWWPSKTPQGADLGIGSGDGWAAYADGEWHEFLHEFVAPYPPEGGNDLCGEICIRIGGRNGAAYYDDVEMYMVKEPDMAVVKSDEAIYYTEWPYGEIQADAIEYQIANMNGASMRYSILDGETVIFPETTVPFVENDGKLSATGRFPTSIMEANKKGQTYSYKAEILNADGKVMQTATGPMYRFDRPHYLGVDGVFRKNGQEYHIGVGNSTNTTRIKQGAKESGLQIVLMVGEGNLTLKEKLDFAHENGLLVMLNMGDSTSCAGSPTRIVQTKKTVEELKDHPALFGYKIQDEPIQKQTKEEYLLAGYVAIREIDPNHVVYACDGVDGSFDVLARYTDWMDTDHYPGGDSAAGRIVETVRNAEAASNGRKPVAFLQKAYEVAPSDTYFPTFHDFRHYGIQGLFAGAGGWGYHAIGKNGTGEPLIEREVWKELVAWKNGGEFDLLHDCFVYGKYPMINAYEGENYMCQLYAVEGKIYAFIISLTGGVGAEGFTQKLDIPLVDASTGKAIGDYTAVLKWGGEGTVTGKDVLSIDLPGFTALTYEITPATAIDFSGYKTVKYNDMDRAPWAYQAVANLYEKNIVNAETSLRYEPQTAITRGDYAMFLVRALGLTAEAGENFADVAPYMEYADALAIGKALGIFEGVGDNRYNPDAPVTRAEIMALTARALRHVGKAADEAASLDAFSDKALIPEWATGDVAAMVGMGIVKGNVDGTVNPLGNTTRAEAAVIIGRVMSR